MFNINAVTNKVLIAIVLILGLVVAVVVFKFQDVKLSTKPTDEINSEIPSNLQDFPVYPKAYFEKVDGERVVWITSDPVSSTIDWFLLEIPKAGWIITEEPDDRGGVEQIIKISKGNLSGYLAAEDEGNTKTEIVLWTQNVE